VSYEAVDSKFLRRITLMHTFSEPTINQLSTTAAVRYVRDMNRRPIFHACAYARSELFLIELEEAAREVREAVEAAGGVAQLAGGFNVVRGCPVDLPRYGLPRSAK
jgi:hypothetical protein